MPKKNAFFWFMLEHKKRLEASGRRFRSLQDVVPLAGKIWEKMDSKERERYAARDGKAAPVTVMHKKPSRHTSAPKSKTTNDEASTKECKRAEKMSALLEKRLRKAEMDDKIEQQDFYLISMEYFCRTVEGLYLPAELGVIKFNLQSGVQEQLHVLMNPGKLPYGCALQAEKHAAVTHALPLPPNALGETDFNDIALKLLAFLKPHDDDSLPLLFTAANSVPMVESMLQRMIGDRIARHTLYVCSVTELLFHLKLAVERHMMSMTVFPSLVAAQQIIDSDMFNFTPKISCQYHESHDLLEHCALSRCIRWAYTISENCSKELGIDLVPGRHVPIDWVVDTVPHIPDATTTVDIAGGIVSAVNERLDDAVVDEDEAGCSGIQRARWSAPSSPERPPHRQNLNEQRQKTDECNDSIHDQPVPVDDESRRRKESATLDVLLSGRGRSMLMNGYPVSAGAGRGYISQREVEYYLSMRGRGHFTPLRGRGQCTRGRGR